MKKLTVIMAIVMFIILGRNKVEEILIPNDAIRIRVIANSNDKKDIEVKENVKDDITPVIYNLLKDVKTINEARNIIKENIPNIDVEVEKSLIRQNRNDKYKIAYGMNYFPEKNFKGVTYEEGYYESLVITLGSGEGSNYWCVLFPPLCMLEFDETEKDNIEYKSFVMELLNKYSK